MADFPGQCIPWTLEPAGYDVPPAVCVRWPLNPTFLGVSGAPAANLVITFVDPIPPNLPSPGRALLFNVTGVTSVGITILAEYSTGAYEVVHDGTDFAQVYTPSSTRVVIQDGFQYLLRRAGGWFGDTVTIRAVAADASA